MHDTADDDFAAADGVDLRKPRKANTAYKPGVADDGGNSETGPSKPQLFPSAIGISVLLPPGGNLQVVTRWGDYLKLADSANPDAATCSVNDESRSPEQQTWQRTPRQEAVSLSHQEITSARGLSCRAIPNSQGLNCIGIAVRLHHTRG